MVIISQRCNSLPDSSGNFPYPCPDLQTFHSWKLLYKTRFLCLSVLCTRYQTKSCMSSKQNVTCGTSCPHLCNCCLVKMLSKNSILLSPLYLGVASRSEGETLPDSGNNLPQHFDVKVTPKGHESTANTGQHCFCLKYFKIHCKQRTCKEISQVSI